MVVMVVVVGCPLFLNESDLEEDRMQVDVLGGGMKQKRVLVRGITRRDCGNGACLYRWHPLDQKQKTAAQNRRRGNKC